MFYEGTEPKKHHLSSDTLSELNFTITVCPSSNTISITSEKKGQITTVLPYFKASTHFMSTTGSREEFLASYDLLVASDLT
jgi:hypothetical protein